MDDTDRYFLTQTIKRQTVKLRELEAPDGFTGRFMSNLFPMTIMAIPVLTAMQALLAAIALDRPNLTLAVILTVIICFGLCEMARPIRVTWAQDKLEKLEAEWDDLDAETDV